jgi:hypothetical protein
MSRKHLGVILLIAGVVTLAVFLLADVIGIGTMLGEFGWVQIGFTVVGLVVSVQGVLMMLRPEKTAD